MWPAFVERARRIDARWAQVEQLTAGALFLLMALLVFVSALTEAVGPSRSSGHVAGLWFVCSLAAWTRRRGALTPWWLALAWGAAWTLVISVALWTYLRWFAGGLIWAQKASLVLMLWICLLGASAATWERAHLTLELGESLWPRAWRRIVRALSRLVAALFCGIAFALALELVFDLHARGLRIESNRWLATWQAIAVLPYAFLAMTVRYVSQAATEATGQALPTHEDAST